MEADVVLILTYNPLGTAPRSASRFSKARALCAECMMSTAAPATWGVILLKKRWMTFFRRAQRELWGRYHAYSPFPSRRNHQVPLLCWCIISLHCLQPWIVSQPFETKGDHAPPSLSTNLTKKNLSKASVILGYLGYLPWHPIFFFKKVNKKKQGWCPQIHCKMNQVWPSGKPARWTMVLLNSNSAPQWLFLSGRTSTGKPIFRCSPM